MDEKTIGIKILPVQQQVICQSREEEKQGLVGTAQVE